MPRCRIFISKKLPRWRDHGGAQQRWEVDERVVTEVFGCLPARTWHQFGYRIVQLGYGRFLAWWKRIWKMKGDNAMSTKTPLVGLEGCFNA